MDINDLKNTSDEQFEKNITFDIDIPKSDNKLSVTIKSARNKSIKPLFKDIYAKSQKEVAKREKPNLTEAQKAVIDAKVEQYDRDICDLVFISFEGLKQGDKAYASNKANMQNLIENYEWIRTAIVAKTVDTDAFYTV